MAKPNIHIITASKLSPPSQEALDNAINKNGYGAKIPTDTMIQVQGSKRWRRVYDDFTGYRAGTSYFIYKGEDWKYLED